MKKKVISIMLCAVMTASLLVGCGSKPVDTVAEEPAQAVEETDAAPAETADTAKGITGEVVYWSMWNETELQAEVLKEAIADFEATNPDCKVTVEWVGRDVLNLVIPAIESGTQVDIFDSDPEGIYRADATKMLNLDALVASKSIDGSGTVEESMITSLLDWDKALAEMVGLQGNYSIPYAPHNVSWFYNKEHFEKAGIAAVPTTWEEFDAACAKLVAAGYAPITTDDAYIAMISSYYLQRAIGSEAVINLARDGGDLWNDPMILQALKDLEDFQKKGYFSKAVETNMYPAGQAEFAMGNASMYLNASWLTSEVAEMAGSDFPWGQFAYPEVKNGKGKITENTIGGQAFMVNSGTTNQEAAFELIRNFISEKTQSKFMENNLVPCTANTDWPAAIADQKDIVSKLTANVRWNAAFSSEFVDAIVNAEFNKVITGKQSAEDTIAKIQKEAKNY